MLHQGEGKAVLVISQFSHNLSVSLSKQTTQRRTRSSCKWSMPVELWISVLREWKFRDWPALSTDWMSDCSTWKAFDDVTFALSAANALRWALRQRLMFLLMFEFSPPSIIYRLPILDTTSHLVAPFLVCWLLCNVMFGANAFPSSFFLDRTQKHTSKPNNSIAVATFIDLFGLSQKNLCNSHPCWKLSAWRLPPFLL